MLSLTVIRTSQTNNPMKKLSLIIILVIASSSSLYSVTNTWDGSTNNNWSEATNWSLNHVPTSLEDVVIPDVDNYCYVSASGGYTAYCKSLEIQAGERLRVGDAIVFVSLDVNIYGELHFSYSDALLVVGFDITWHSGSTANITQGWINLSGNWYFNNGTGAQLSGTNVVTFEGSIHQGIYCSDSDARFNDVVIDQTGSVATLLDESSTEDIHISGELTINPTNTLEVQEALTVDDTLSVDNTGKLYLTSAGGSLTANSDVNIDGLFYLNGGDALVNGDFDVNATGTLVIFSGELHVNTLNFFDVYGTFNMSDGLIYNESGPFWINAGATTNITGGTIRTRHFSATSAGTFQPSGGTVEIYNDVAIPIAYIIDCPSSNYFHNLKINLVTGDEAEFQSDVLVQNDLTIQSGTLTYEYYGAPYDVTVNHDLKIYGHFELLYSNTLTVDNDITWYSGSTSNIAGGMLSLSGDWYFNNGTGAQLSGTNTVTFDGVTSQLIYCLDADAQFNNVVIDQSGSAVTWLHESSTEDIHIAGNLTINPSNRLQVETEALTVDGTLDVQNTGELYMEDPGGSLVNNSNFTLDGEMFIHGGDALIHGEFEIGATGELTIQSGSFEYDVGSGQNGIFGILNISGGTYRPDETIWIDPAGVVNMTGGVISANSGFQAQYTGNFQPSGGIVEFKHTHSGFSVMELTNGNYFLDVRVDCSNENGGVWLDSDVIIQNDLEILDGTVELNGNSLEAQDDVEVYGDLWMHISGDELIVGNDITFYSGSQTWSFSEISLGVINVAGDWYFNNGTAAQLTGTNTVTFNGASSQFIYCMDTDAHFNNVIIDKTTTLATWLHASSTEDIHLAGDLTINPSNTLQVETEALTVDGIIDVQNTGRLMLEDVGGSLVNNSAFALDGELIIDGGDALIHGDFFVSATGELTLESGSIENSGTGSVNAIHGILNISGGHYTALEYIYVSPTGFVNMTGGIITSISGFHATYSNTFQPTGGYVEIKNSNSTFAGILCNNGNYFRDLKIECSHTTGGVYLAADILVQNNLEILDGAVQIAGYILQVQGDLDIHGNLYMTDSDDEVYVGNDITFYSGSNIGSYSEISTGTIDLAGDWYFNNGTGAQLTGTNSVTFNGTSSQFIYCLDADAQFHDVVIDQTGSTTTSLHPTSSEDIHIAGDLTINPSNTLQVETEALIVDGTIDVQNTGRLMLEDAGGSLVANSPFDLDGEMTIAGGDAEVFGNFQINPTGVLSMMDGAYTIHNTSYTTVVSGELNLYSTCAMIVYGDFNAASGSDVNMSGGLLKIGQSIITTLINIFQPSGGEVEFFGSNQSLIQVDGSNGNYLPDLTINKNPGIYAFLTMNTQVNNDLSVDNGYLKLNDQTLDVNGDVDIFGRLVMTDNSDILNVENDFRWYSGSTDEIINGNINIEGNWFFNSGTQCDLNAPASTNTVHFIGTDVSVINSNEAIAAFNHVTINKTSPPNDKVTVTGTQALNIKGTYTLDDGEFILETDVTIGD